MLTKYKNMLPSGIDTQSLTRVEQKDYRGNLRIELSNDDHTVSCLFYKFGDTIVRLSYVIYGSSTYERVRWEREDNKWIIAEHIFQLR